MTIQEEIDKLKVRRDALVEQHKKLASVIDSIDDQIKKLTGKLKNPSLKPRPIEVLRPLMTERRTGWTREEMYNAVKASGEIRIRRFDTNFKTSITRSLREKTLEIRDGLYYLTEKGLKKK